MKKRELTRAALLAAAAIASLLEGIPQAVAQSELASAIERYDRGVALYERKRYRRALEELRASMSLYGSPNTRLYIGRTLRQLGRLPEAAAELEMAQREARERSATDSRYVATREAARAERRALEPRLGHVLLRLRGVPESARVSVGGQSVAPAARNAPILVAAGVVEVVVESPGRAAERRQLSVAAGETRILELDLSPLAAPAASPSSAPTRRHPAGIAPTALERPPAAARTRPRALRLLGWSSAGAGAALLATSTVLFWQTARTHDELERCDANLGCALTTQREPIASRGRTLEALAYVSAGLGVAAGLAGAWLLLRGTPQGKRSEGRPGVALLVGGGAAVLNGLF